MSESWRVQSIFHFTVNASNFERSVDFYTTLGFRVLRDNRDVVWPEMVAKNFGMPAAQGRGALLGIGDGPEHTRLDLIEWLRPPPPPPAHPRTTPPPPRPHRVARARTAAAVRPAHHRPAHRERGGRLRGPEGTRHPVRVRAAAR